VGDVIPIKKSKEELYRKRVRQLTDFIIEKGLSDEFNKWAIEKGID
jgi:hypothetical protein